jgi:hypothetical protein
MKGALCQFHMAGLCVALRFRWEYPFVRTAKESKICFGGSVTLALWFLLKRVLLALTRKGGSRLYTTALHVLCVGFVLYQKKGNDVYGLGTV